MQKQGSSAAGNQECFRSLVGSGSGNSTAAYMPKNELASERTHGSANPVGQRPKRAITKTWKAIEAEQSAHILLSRSVKMKKRKRFPLSLPSVVRIPPLDKPGAKNVVLAPELVREGGKKRSAEMATKRVRKEEEKENEAPGSCTKDDRTTASTCLRFKVAFSSSDNMPYITHSEAPAQSDSKYKTESLLAMDKDEETGKEEEREKEGEVMHRSKKMWNPPPEVVINPNYCPIKNEKTPSTNQIELEQSVLNDSVRLISRPSHYHRRLNRHEEMLLECEDDRFELDMLVEVLRSTIKQTELWIEEIKRGSSKPMESYFSGRNRLCVENLYGDRGLEMVTILQERPSAAPHVVLARLRQKEEEVDQYRTEFNNTMTDMFCQHFKKSLGFGSQ